jgi:hypothetical protein
MPLPLTPISTTSTFRQWFNLTNNVVSILNASVVADNVTAFGVFTIGANSNTSLAVTNNFFVNTTAISFRANTTLNSNVVIASTANLFNISANIVLLQPAQGTIVNTLLTMNANAVFLQPITVNSTMNVAGNLVVGGNLTIANGEIIIGPINARQIEFTQAGAVIVPTIINSPEVDDYNPTGLENCTVLNLQTNIDTVVTGLNQPTGFVSGARTLYVQNIGATGKITLASGNTSSQSNNRFKTPNDAPLDLLPGGAVVLIWTSSNQNWRVAGGGPASTTQSIAVVGNGSIGGNLTVTGLSNLNGNVQFGNVALWVDVLNKRVGVGTSSLTSGIDFQVAGNTQLNTTTVTGPTTLQGVITSTSNTSLANATLILNTASLSATFGNTFAANSTNQSFVRNLKANTLTSDGTTSLANTSISGNTAITAKVIISGASGRLVIPVGTNLWAT